MHHCVMHRIRDDRDGDASIRRAGATISQALPQDPLGNRHVTAQMRVQADDR